MKFLRRTWYKLPSLGKGRKKKQKWRNPTGRHNKIRNKRRGYSARVEIGYKTDKKARGKINEKIPKKVFNAKQLENVGKNEIAVIGKVGMRKRMEIAKKAKEMKIEVHNLNLEKFLEDKNSKEGKK